MLLQPYLYKKILKIYLVTQSLEAGPGKLQRFGVKNAPNIFREEISRALTAHVFQPYLKRSNLVTQSLEAGPGERTCPASITRDVGMKAGHRLHL
jgi:hypothetical protein